MVEPLSKFVCPDPLVSFFRRGSLPAAQFQTCQEALVASAQMENAPTSTNSPTLYFCTKQRKYITTSQVTSGERKPCFFEGFAGVAIWHVGWIQVQLELWAVILEKIVVRNVIADVLLQQKRCFVSPAARHIANVVP